MEFEEYSNDTINFDDLDAILEDAFPRFYQLLEYSPHFMIALSLLGIAGNVLLFIVSRHIVLQKKTAG